MNRALLGAVRRRRRGRHRRVGQRGRRKRRRHLGLRLHVHRGLGSYPRCQTCIEEPRGVVVSARGHQERVCARSSVATWHNRWDSRAALNGTCTPWGRERSGDASKTSMRRRHPLLGVSIRSRSSSPRRSRRRGTSTRRRGSQKVTIAPGARESTTRCRVRCRRGCRHGRNLADPETPLESFADRALTPSNLARR